MVTLVLPSSSPPAPRAAPLTTLNPGDVAFGVRGDRMETLLGSCVAIVLTDPRRSIGVMCHIVHSRQQPAGTRPDPAYAEAAVEAMYALLRARGITPQMCEAYVYGGGNMFPALFTRSHVGADNSRWVLDRLAHERIRVLQVDVGGNVYRRLAWTVGPELPVAVSIPV